MEGEDIKTLQKRVCSQALTFSVVGALILIIIGQKAVGKGLILGTFFSVANFLLMARFLHHSLSTSRTTASIASLFSILVRFALLAVPLVISIRHESIHLLGAIVGIFMVQLTVLLNNIISERISSSQ